MANTWTNVVPQLLAQGLVALRERVVLPRAVNSEFSAMAGQKGSTIDVPVSSAVTATAVSPAITPPANSDSSPTTVAIALDQWYEAPFYLTDKEELEVMDGTIPMQASEAIKALANQVESHLFTQFEEGTYGYAGTAGTTPFASDLTAFTAARKNLNTQLADKDPRFCVIDDDAEANALNLRAFQDASFRGDVQGIINGEIGRKLGSTWIASNQVPTHSKGTQATTGMLVNNVAGYSVGDTSIAIDGGSGTLVAYDVISFAGHSQTYKVTAAVADTSSGTMTITPGLQAAVANNEAITLRDDHVLNLNFHRDAVAFATRPLDGVVRPGLGSIVQNAVDPESGLALRLEVTRQHKQTRYAYDILWGAQMIRPEFATIIAG